MFSTRQRLALYLSILSVNFHSGASLVLTSPGNSTIPAQNTTLTGSLANDVAPHCVNHLDWKSGGLIMHDCRRLVHWFWSSLLPRYDDVFEFVGPDFKPDNPDAVRTPRKYTHHTCTLAIVMMTADIDMPNRPLGPWHNRDYESIGHVASAAIDLLEGCVSSPARSPGWKNIGFYESIGVILWTTGSTEDKRVPADPPNVGSLEVA